MSGNFAMPYHLTGGAGYKANSTYENVMPAGIRRGSAAFREMDKDKQASNGLAQGAEGGDRRRSSVVHGSAVTSAQAERRGSVLVGSSATRKDSIFGLEASAGTTMDSGRRPSTSLASDLYHKMKGDRKGST